MHREEKGWHTIYEDAVIKSVAAKYSVTPAQVSNSHILTKHLSHIPRQTTHFYILIYMSLSTRVTPAPISLSHILVTP